MEFSSLNSCPPSTWVAQRKSKKDQHKMMYVMMQRKKPPTDMGMRRHSFNNIPLDLEPEAKGRYLSKRRSSVDKTQRCKTSDSTKRKLDFRLRQLEMFSKYAHLPSTTDFGHNHYVNFDTASGMTTVDMDQEGDDMSPQELNACTVQNQRAWTKWSQNVKGVTNRFAKDTTAHGYKHIAIKKRGKFHRLAWILAILTVTALMVHLTYAAFLQHQAHFFTSSVKSQPSKALLFPTVTVCSPNLWNANTINYILRQSLQGNETEMELPASNPSNSTKRLANVTVIQLWNAFEAKFEDYFRSCHWNGQPFKCEDSFISTTLDTSGCFSFNWNQSSQHHVDIIGPLSGLSVQLDLGTFHFDGIKVVIHDPTEVPNVLETGIFVGAGNLAHVGFSRNEYRFLPRPYMAYGTDYCEDAADGSDVTNDHSYSLYQGHSACLADCRLEYIVRKCGCRGALFPDIKGVPYCRLNQMDCVIEAQKSAFKFRLGDDVCACPLPCNKVEYSWRMSASYSKDRFVTVNVFYEELVTRIEEHLPMYTWPSVLGIIGGNMGLLTGASVLTLVEFLELLTLLLGSSWASLCSS